MTIVTGTTSVTDGAAGGAGHPVSLARSPHRDTAAQIRPSEMRPQDDLEEGIDERLLRELAERVRCERLRHNLQRSADPQTGGCSLRPRTGGRRLRSSPPERK